MFYLWTVVQGVLETKPLYAWIQGPLGKKPYLSAVTEVVKMSAEVVCRVILGESQRLNVHPLQNYITSNSANLFVTTLLDQSHLQWNPSNIDKQQY